MKLLLILLIICLDYSSSQNIESKVPTGKFPKKVLVNSGLYKVNYSNKLVSKKPLKDQSYTAFAPPEKQDNVPESLFFPLQEQLSDPEKPRVKKVLPEYFWKPRSKRSADQPKTPEKENPEKLQSKPARRSGKKKSKVRAATTNNAKNAQGAKKLKALQKSKKLRSKAVRPTKTKTNKAKPIKRNQKQTAANGTKKEPDLRRLISARSALIEDYPYVVSIQKDGQHWCAGALLNPRLIITTANCMWKSTQVSRMRVRAGSRHSHQGGQVAKIQEVIKHPGWKIRKNPNYDLALALLDRNIRFSNSVHGVDIPNISMMPPFDDAWVTSWGSERRDGVYDSSTTSLQVYHVRLMERAECNNITVRFGVTVTENFICLTQSGRRAPCTRDTGAPAVSDGVLWGVASWGIRKLCGTERYPAMFSYLASKANLDFITNATHILMAEERHYPMLDRMPRARVAPTLPTTITMPYK